MPGLWAAVAGAGGGAEGGAAAAAAAAAAAVRSVATAGEKGCVGAGASLVSVDMGLPWARDLRRECARPKQPTQGYLRGVSPRDKKSGGYIGKFGRTGASATALSGCCPRSSASSHW